MPRYRNSNTGVVVDIPESLADQIGGYEPVGQPTKKETPKRPKNTKKSDD